MDTARLAPVYLVGIALNVAAVGYAIAVEEWPFAVTFGVVLLYLAFRYRTLKRG